MKMYLKASFVLLAFVVVTISSCKKNDLPIKSKEFHFVDMGTKLEDKTLSQCIGLQYAIRKGTELKAEGATGFSILLPDGLQKPYTVENRKSVHSCSKTLSAATLVSVLELNKVKLTESIYDFLPSSWRKHNLVKKITFLELLTHKSGLRGTRDSYNQMRDYIKDGSFASKSYEYANVNFSLMRLLIPMINAGNRKVYNETLEKDGGAAFNSDVSNSYVNHVRQICFTNSGIDEKAGPYIWDGTQNLNPTRNYNYKDGTLSGYTHPNFTLLTGAGGWYLNANEYSDFIAHLFQNDYPYVDSDEMMNKSLGMYNNERGGVKYVTHNGAITTGNGRGGVCVWIYIPATQTTFVTQVNSANNIFTVGELENMMLDSYLESYY